MLTYYGSKQYFTKVLKERNFPFTAQTLFKCCFGFYFNDECMLLTKSIRIRYQMNWVLLFLSTSSFSLRYVHLCSRYLSTPLGNVSVYFLQDFNTIVLFNWTTHLFPLTTQSTTFLTSVLRSVYSSSDLQT